MNKKKVFDFGDIENVKNKLLHYLVKSIKLVAEEVNKVQPEQLVVTK